MRNFTYSDELYHFGILGMKWGVRRYQNEDGTRTEAGKARYSKSEYKSDKKLAKRMKRRLAAEKRVLKDAGVVEKRMRNDYGAANKEYERALRSSSGLFGLRSKEKAMRVNAAQENLDAASDRYMSAKERFERIKQRTLADSEKYIKHVDSMINKYSDKKISPVKTKEMKLGENWVQSWVQAQNDENDSWFDTRRDKREKVTVAKTGITVADLPAIGRWYSGRVGSDIDYEERKKEMDEAAAINNSYNRYIKEEKRRR